PPRFRSRERSGLRQVHRCQAGGAAPDSILGAVELRAGAASAAVARRPLRWFRQAPLSLVRPEQAVFGPDPGAARALFGFGAALDAEPLERIGDALPLHPIALGGQAGDLTKGKQLFPNDGNRVGARGIDDAWVGRGNEARAAPLAKRALGRQ